MQLIICGIKKQPAEFVVVTAISCERATMPSIGCLQEFPIGDV